MRNYLDVYRNSVDERVTANKMGNILNTACSFDNLVVDALFI